MPVLGGLLTCWSGTSRRPRRTAGGSLISRMCLRPAGLLTRRSSPNLFARKIVGWQVAGHLRAGLALDALEMAIFARQDGIGDQLVHHSDRGVQYTSIRYTQRLGDIGAVRSVGSKGDSYDNAAAEAVNSLYKKELINCEGPWEDAGQVTVATAEWVSWYNDDRLHSACGNIPPREYENAWLTRNGHTIIIPEAKAS